MIELIVEPRAVKTWDEFLKENPPYSIALDGYVLGPTREDHKGPRLNINDHDEKTPGLSNISTSSQAWIRLKLGLYKIFKENNTPKANIYVNDCDQDSSLATALLKNHDKYIGTEKESRVETLVNIENLLDITAGAYPFNPNSEMMEEIAWVFQPYGDLRIIKDIGTMNSSEMKKIIEKICERVEIYSLGKNGRIKLNTRYQVIYNGKGWKIIYELGESAKMKAFSDGIISFVSVRERDDKNLIYSVINIIPYTNLSAENFYQELNNREGISMLDNDKWEGNDFKGGSPRQKGSKIKPKELGKLIDALIR